MLPLLLTCWWTVRARFFSLQWTTPRIFPHLHGKGAVSSVPSQAEEARRSIRQWHGRVSTPLKTTAESKKKGSRRWNVTQVPKSRLLSINVSVPKLAVVWWETELQRACGRMFLRRSFDQQLQKTPLLLRLYFWLIEGHPKKTAPTPALHGSGCPPLTWRVLMREYKALCMQQKKY